MPWGTFISLSVGKIPICHADSLEGVCVTRLLGQNSAQDVPRNSIARYSTVAQGEARRPDVDWAEVKLSAYQQAKRQIFNDLACDPNCTFAQVEELAQSWRTNGMKFRFNGQYTCKYLGVESSQWAGNVWTGSRQYKFDFQIEITPM